MEGMTLDLARLRELEKAATKSPWRLTIESAPTLDHEPTNEDMELIEAMRNAAPALLALAAEAMAARKWLEAEDHAQSRRMPYRPDAALNARIVYRLLIAAHLEVKDGGV